MEIAYAFDANINPDLLDKFVEQHEYGSVFQQKRWTSIKSNWDNYHVAVLANDRIVAGAQILSRNIAFGYKLFYIPRGPILDYNDKELMEFFFSELKSWAKKQRAAFIKFDPLILNSSVDPNGLQQDGLNEDIIDELKSIGCIHHGLTMGFEETVQPRTQAVIDLAAQYKINKKLKYYLNHARKKGVQVKRLTADGVELFARLESLTAERKNIALRSKEYFQSLMDTYGDDANISIAFIDIHKTIKEEEERLFDLQAQIKNPQYKAAKLTEIQEQIDSTNKSISVLESMRLKYGEIVSISGALIIRSGRYSEVLYAGMDEDLSIYRSNSSFQDAIDWAKEKGCRYCNLGGVEGTLDDSLTSYKKLYNPTFESYIGEYDLPINKVIYLAVTKMLPMVREFHTILARRKKHG